MTTYCDVNTCEDCTRCGDDCDGDKRVEHTDYISRADAIEMAVDVETPQGTYERAIYVDDLMALPSADAEPKRVLQGYFKGANTIQTIRHEELTQIANTRKAVESAEAVQGWIPHKGGDTE